MNAVNLLNWLGGCGDNRFMTSRAAARGVKLTTNLSSDDAIPYFLWNDPMTVGELRRRLEGPDEDRERLLGTILREAREPDVWMFTSPQEVAAQWGRLERYLGRRQEFWRFLLGKWRELGLLD